MVSKSLQPAGPRSLHLGAVTSRHCISTFSQTFLLFEFVFTGRVVFIKADSVQ